MAAKKSRVARITAIVFSLAAVLGMIGIDGGTLCVSAAERAGKVITDVYDQITITCEDDEVPTIEFASKDLGSASTELRTVEKTVFSSDIAKVQAPGIRCENDLDTESEYKHYDCVCFFSDHEYSKELTTDVPIEDGDVKFFEIGKSYNLFFAFRKKIAEGEYEYKEITKGAVYSVNYVNPVDALKYMCVSDSTNSKYILRISLDKTSVKTPIGSLSYYIGTKANAADISSSEWHETGIDGYTDNSPVPDKNYAFFKYEIEQSQIQEIRQVGNSLYPVRRVNDPVVGVSPSENALVQSTNDKGVVVKTAVSNITTANTVTVTFQNAFDDNADIKLSDLEGVSGVTEEDRDIGMVQRSLHKKGESVTFTIKNSKNVTGEKNYTFSISHYDDPYVLSLNYTDVAPQVTVTKPEPVTYSNAADTENSVPVEASASIKNGSTLSEIVSTRYFNETESGDLTVGALHGGVYPITGRIQLAKDGIYKYKIEVTNKEGQTAESDAFQIIKDTVYPVVSDVAVKQDGSALTNGQKAVVSKETTVEFNVSDALSGVKKVTTNASDADVVSDDNGKYHISFPADTLELDKEYKIAIVAEDNAGNSTEQNPYVVTIATRADGYTIKFVDEDGSDLQSGKVAYGQVPEYTGKKPTKEADSKHTYEFQGWTPDITAVTRDATYTAVYSSSEIPVPPAKGSYKVAKGEGAEYKQGSDSTLTFVIKRTEKDETTFDHFSGVNYNGKTLKQGKQYTAAKGSVIIELQPEFLKTLSAGSRTVTVTFDDGDDVDAHFTVREAKKENKKDNNKENKKDNNKDKGKGSKNRTDDDHGQGTSGRGSGSPATGDTSSVCLWVILLILSAGILTVLVVRKRAER